MPTHVEFDREMSECLHECIFQCDQMFCEKNAQNNNIAHNEALVSKNFCTKNFLVKIWES
jgi:hypothetical protein